MSAETVHVSLMGKEYQVSCPTGEAENLHASARLLDMHMRRIKDGGRVIGLDRIAIMAALNLANELIAKRQTDEEYQAAGERMLKLSEQIATVLDSK